MGHVACAVPAAPSGDGRSAGPRCRLCLSRKEAAVTLFLQEKKKSALVRWGCHGIFPPTAGR